MSTAIEEPLKILPESSFLNDLHINKCTKCFQHTFIMICGYQHIEETLKLCFNSISFLKISKTKFVILLNHTQSKISTVLSIFGGKQYEKMDDDNVIKYIMKPYQIIYNPMNSLQKIQQIMESEYRQGIKWCKVILKDCEQPKWIEAKFIGSDDLEKYQNKLVGEKQKNDQQNLKINQKQQFVKNDEGDKLGNEGQKMDGQLMQGQMKGQNCDKQQMGQKLDGNHSEISEINYTPEEEGQNSDKQGESESVFGQYRPYASMIGSKNKTKSKFPKITSLKTKIKTKNIHKQSVSRREHSLGLDTKNILATKFRQTDTKNYRQDFPLSHKKSKQKKVRKFDLSEIDKKINKCRKNEQALIQSVKSSYEIGGQKYFCVDLLNGDEIMISEMDMNKFFPNKLTVYYQNLISNLTSTFLVPK